MRKTRSRPAYGVLILFTLLLCVPAPAESFSFEDEFEVKMCPAGTVLAEPIEGDPNKAMALVEELYRLAGPKIGCRLVEPVYLLCFGDLRPYAAWNGFMVDPAAGDDAVIDKLNSYLVPRGYSLHPRKPDNGKTAAFSLRSLEGLEKRTRESKLDWVPKYDRDTGWPGYYAWKDEAYRRLPVKGSDAFHHVEGIMLGYPDAAVEHYDELVWNGWPTTVDSYTPAAFYYVCGVPIFSLRCQDASDPAVVTLEKEWQTFLQESYATLAHQRLAADPRFEEQRLRLASDGKDGEGDPRYSEARRLGLTTHTSPLSLNSHHERWLVANLARVLEQLESSSDIAGVTRLGASVELESGHVWNWLLRGSLNVDPASQALFSAFSSRYPQTYGRLYRTELTKQAKTILRRGKAGSDPGWDSEGLSQMLGSGFGQSYFASLAEQDQLLVFQAVETRRDHPPLRAILEQAAAGKGAYASVLRKLRRTHPALWSQKRALKAAA